jgi:hypothetical protein
MKKITTKIIFIFIFFILSNIISYSQISLPPCEFTYNEMLEFLDNPTVYLYEDEENYTILGTRNGRYTTISSITHKLTSCKDTIMPVGGGSSTNLAGHVVQELQSLGPDKDIYSIYEIILNDTTHITLPWVCKDGDTMVTIYGKFALFGTNIGEKKTVCLFYFAGNGALVYGKLIFEILGLTASPIPLDFGNIFTNRTYSDKIKIENQNIDPATIRAAYLQNGTDFKLETELENVFIDGLDSIFAEISINSSTAGEKTDTLIIEADYPTCGQNNLRIPISANVAEPIKFTIRASEHKQTDPRKKNYRIPIYIKASADTSNITIEELVIEIDENLYSPRRVDNGTFSKNYIDSIIEITFKNITVPSLQAGVETVLLNVRGDVILGNKDSSDIFIKSVNFSEELQEESDFINGFITLDICQCGNDRLLTNFDYVPAITVKNNPVITDVLEVECKTVERGNYSLEIVDLLGNATTVKEFTVSANGKRIFDFEIPIQNYGNGNYIIAMNTPTVKYSQKFIINK